MQKNYISINSSINAKPHHTNLQMYHYKTLAGQGQAPTFKGTGQQITLSTIILSKSAGVEEVQWKFSSVTAHPALRN